VFLVLGILGACEGITQTALDWWSVKERRGDDWLLQHAE
jgi:hypothetical protein